MAIYVLSPLSDVEFYYLKDIEKVDSFENRQYFTFEKGKSYEVEFIPKNMKIGMLFDNKFFQCITKEKCLSYFVIEELDKVIESKKMQIKKYTLEVMNNYNCFYNSHIAYDGFLFKKDQKYEVTFEDRDVGGKEGLVNGMVLGYKFFARYTADHIKKNCKAFFTLTELEETKPENPTEVNALNLLLDILNNYFSYFIVKKYGLGIKDGYIVNLKDGYIVDPESSYCLDYLFNIYDKNKVLIHKNIDFKQTFMIFLSLMTKDKLKNYNFEDICKEYNNIIEQSKKIEIFYINHFKQKETTIYSIEELKSFKFIDINTMIPLESYKDLKPGCKVFVCKEDTHLGNLMIINTITRL